MPSDTERMAPSNLKEGEVFSKCKFHRLGPMEELRLLVGLLMSHALLVSSMKKEHYSLSDYLHAIKYQTGLEVNCLCCVCLPWVEMLVSSVYDILLSSLQRELHLLTPFSSYGVESLVSSVYGFFLSSSLGVLHFLTPFPSYGVEPLVPSVYHTLLS